MTFPQAHQFFKAGELIFHPGDQPLTWLLFRSDVPGRDGILVVPEFGLFLDILLLCSDEHHIQARIQDHVFRSFMEQHQQVWWRGEVPYRPLWTGRLEGLMWRWARKFCPELPEPSGLERRARVCEEAIRIMWVASLQEALAFEPEEKTA